MHEKPLKIKPQLKKFILILFVATFISSSLPPQIALGLDFGDGGLDIGGFGDSGGGGSGGIDFGNSGLDAGGGGGDTGTSGIDFSGSLNEVPTKDQKVRWYEKAFNLKEFNGDKLAYLIANQAIESLSASIVDWINSGFEGKPAFVQDLKRHFSDLESEILGSYLNEIGAGFLCSPFADKIKRSLEIRLAITQAGGRYARESLFRNANQCTLDDVFSSLGTSLEQFSNDFSQGGWDAWVTMVEPRNHELGAYLIVRNELFRRQNEAVVNAKAELNFGQGFLSWKKCTPSVSSGNSTPGIDFGNAVDGNTDSTPGIDFSGNSKPGLFTSTEFGQDCQTVTPGSVIEEQLNKSLGSGQRRLEVADEVNEIVIALMSQLMNQALGGVNGLLGASQSSSGGSSYTDQIRNNQVDLTRSKNTLLVQIDDSIREVNGVIYIKEISITDINNVLGLLETTNQCLVEKRNSGSPDTLGEQNYQENKSQLETTKNILTNDINNLMQVKTALLQIRGGVVAATTLEGISQLSDQYSDSLLNLGFVSNTVDAQSDLESLRRVLELVRQENQADLIRCQQVNNGFTF